MTTNIFEYVESIIDRMDLDIQVLDVTDASEEEENTYILSVDKTWYLNDGRKFVYNSQLLTVKSYVRNSSITVYAYENAPEVGTISLPTPKVLRGKYLQAQATLTTIIQEIDTNTIPPYPFVWLVQTQPRRQHTSRLSALESDGDVRMLWLHETNREFLNKVDSRRVIQPMQEIVDYFTELVRRECTTGFLNQVITTIEHSEASTGSGQNGQSSPSLFMGAFSGVEVLMPLPIRKPLTIERVRPLQPPPPPGGQRPILIISNKALVIGQNVLILQTN